MVGWYHRLEGHELERAPGDSEGHWRDAVPGFAELDTTEQLNGNHS